MPSAKKIPAKRTPTKKPSAPDPEITGPSSEPKQPVFTLASPTAAPIVRGGLQGLTGGFVVEGMIAFGVALTDRQSAWLAIALGFGINATQNVIERWRGRRLIGAAR